MRSAIVFLLYLLAFHVHAAPSSTIGKVQGTIVLDGDVNDSGWTNALRIDDFVEFAKADNAAPPVHTTAWLTYDEHYLYVAFRNDDPNPGAIRAPFVDRDNVSEDQDFVSIILDTMGNRQSAVELKVNARGVQTDSVYSEARDINDLAPDFFYDTAARTTPSGWTAEMRIPLSSLHYAGADQQSWGFILIRNYPRDFRYVMASTHLPKGRSCYLCYANTLAGLSNLPNGGHLTLAPYSTAARDEQRVGTRLAPDPVRGDSGLDLKWSPSPKLAVDATVNPDFSQIESDVPQVSANSRVAFSYPEKRPFFLEGVDLLSTPIRAVYTRAITAPAWGVRATGQSGSTAYTLLATEDRGGGAVVIPGAEGSSSVPQDFRSLAVVGRVRTSIGASFAGLLLTDREVQGGGHNRVIGPDFLWKISGSDKLQGQALVSDTENPNRTDLSPLFDGRSATGHAGRVVYNRDTNRYDVFAAAADYSNGWREDNGFTPWAGMHANYVEVGGHMYPSKGFASYIRPFIGVGRETAWRGESIGFYFEGKFGTNGWIAFHPGDQDRVNGVFVDPYKYTEVHLNAAPSRFLPAISLDGSFGDRVDYSNARIGSGASLTLKTTARPTTHLELSANITREWLNERGAQLYAADIDRLKISYVFDQRSIARIIVQKNNTDRATWMYRTTVAPRDGDLTLSALYGYRVNWQTTFYAGYGDFRLLDENERFLPNHRSFFVKASYAFQR